MHHQLMVQCSKDTHMYMSVCKFITFRADEAWDFFPHISFTASPSATAKLSLLRANWKRSKVELPLPGGTAL